MSYESDLYQERGFNAGAIPLRPYALTLLGYILKEFLLFFFVDSFHWVSVAP
jgi:hypothetical protein